MKKRKSKGPSVEPVGDKVYLQLEEVRIGALHSGGAAPIHEWGTVIAVGPQVKSVKPGNIVFFKAWGVDIITRDGEKHYFISEKSDAICAIVK